MTHARWVVFMEWKKPFNVNISCSQSSEILFKFENYWENIKWISNVALLFQYHIMHGLRSKKLLINKRKCGMDGRFVISDKEKACTGIEVNCGRNDTGWMGKKPICWALYLTKVLSRNRSSTLAEVQSFTKGPATGSESISTITPPNRWTFFLGSVPPENESSFSCKPTLL